jgi:hypothetical protein
MQANLTSHFKIVSICKHRTRVRTPHLPLRQLIQITANLNSNNNDLSLETLCTRMQH